MTSFLESWKARTENVGGDGMSDEDKVAELRKVAEEYKERFDANPWVQGVQASL